ncbi:hypothetical protein [Paenibacillus sp. Pae15]|uniref:hypothetical protein n=1 Tax=unclassified Paenibacillus TaxID=185978 RepID=UPI0035C723A8
MGFVYFSVYTNIVTLKDIIRIHHIHIKSTSRGIRYGTYVINHLKSNITQKLLKLELETHRTNIDARTFYLKKGFIEENELIMYHT